MTLRRRIVCRRFGASICLGARSPGCKNDRGIAENVKVRQRARAAPAGKVPNSADHCPLAMLFFATVLCENRGSFTRTLVGDSVDEIAGMACACGCGAGRTGRGK
ncbi:hypothetical protein DN388_18155 [Pseudomonas sp. S12(2018)]|nr:hypothetical protein [Pseudomonas sp. S12(2018)]PPS63113.1 hypothetical protein CR917_19965 [Pseudomonas sp. BRM28]